MLELCFIMQWVKSRYPRVARLLTCVHGESYACKVRQECSVYPLGWCALMAWVCLDFSDMCAHWECCSQNDSRWHLLPTIINCSFRLQESPSGKANLVQKSVRYERQSLPWVLPQSPCHHVAEQRVQLTKCKLRWLAERACNFMAREMHCSGLDPEHARSLVGNSAMHWSVTNEYSKAFDTVVLSCSGVLYLSVNKCRGTEKAGGTDQNTKVIADLG